MIVVLLLEASDQKTRLKGCDKQLLLSLNVLEVLAEESLALCHLT